MTLVRRWDLVSAAALATALVACNDEGGTQHSGTGSTSTSPSTGPSASASGTATALSTAETAEDGCADPDADDDGFDAQQCGGDDCDDADATSFPGADEVCDLADNDCDGVIDWGRSVPSDFPSIAMALDGAEPGAHICVGPGTYEESISIGADIVVAAGPSDDSTTTSAPIEIDSS